MFDFGLSQRFTSDIDSVFGQKLYIEMNCIAIVSEILLYPSSLRRQSGKDLQASAVQRSSAQYTQEIFACISEDDAFCMRLAGISTYTSGSVG